MSMEHALRDKMVAFGFETLTVSTAAIGPTLATISPGPGYDAQYGLFTVRDDAVRFRFDGGDPDANTGHYLAESLNLEIHGAENLRNLKFIRVNTDAKVTATYCR